MHLACFMPFDKVAEMMEELLGVATTEETVRRHTEQVGSWMEAWQTAEVEAESSPEEDLERPLQRCVFSPDGAMVSLVHKQWAETRTVAIGEPQEKRNAKGEREIHVGKLSYFSRLADASTFTRLAEVEMRRRRVKEAKKVSAVMDGADWCQMFTDHHRPDAVRILDFPHGGEHINELLEALGKAKMHFPPHMLERCLHVLKHRGPRPLLRMADRMPNDLAGQKGVHEHLDYLHKREAMMQYPQFRRDGWPIGSGMVESANKNVVEARLKGTGMHWQRKNVNPMLALRNAVCNGRWREMWQKSVLQHRKLHALQRSARVKPGAQALVAVGNTSSPESPPQSPAISKPPSSPAHALPASEPKSSSVTSPSPAPTGTQSSSPRPSSRRKKHTARNRVKYAHQRSGEANGEVCPCGTPLVRLRGQRTKQYCSDRCRQRAYRQRQTHSKLLSAPAESAVTLPASSRPSHHRREGGTDRAPMSAHVRCLPQGSGEVSRESCICGTPLVQPIGGQSRRYCSDRCRQRAYRQRQRWVS